MDGESVDGEELLRRQGASPRSRQEASAVEQAPLLATALPLLRPGMLLRRRQRVTAPFPLDEPGTSRFFFARNGIYELARLWSLHGREVLFPAYFHGVELEALVDAGVQPRFYPVGPRMEVDPTQVIGMVRPETAAVYLIHYLGFPGPAEELAQACRARGIRLIEDCALALLSKNGDTPLGAHGDAAVFCLYKTLPTPNGGLVRMRDGPLGRPEGVRPGVATTLAPVVASLLQGMELRGGPLGKRIRSSIRWAGRLISGGLGVERVATGTQHFDRSRQGLSMSALSQVVIEAQDFEAIVERRRRNYFHLLGRLRGISAPIFGELPPGVCPLFYPLVTDRKAEVLEALALRGIEAVDFWGRHHPLLPAGIFPDVDELRRKVLEIPCHQDLAPETIDRMAAEIEAVIGSKAASR